MAVYPSTHSVHAGETKLKPYGAVTVPIVQTSTYTFRDSAEIMQFMQAKAAGAQEIRDEYGRYGNPTQAVAESKVAALENGEKALLFSSGMSAISTTFLALLSAGDHVILVRDSYRRTRQLAETFLPRWGIEATFIHIGETGALEKAIQPNTRLLYSETPTNPYLRVMDIQEMVTVARRHQLLTVLDSTFATPINLRPIERGVNIVIQSATKYLGGHNDLLAGAVIGASADLEKIQRARDVLGGISNPFEAYLLLRGLKTLALRVQKMNANGMQVAQYLENQLQVRRVYYPGLTSHPDHAAASRQMSGFGGVVSFEIDGDFQKTARFIDLLRLPYIGPTLGGVESIVQQPAAFFSRNPEERHAAGIKDNLVRYAIGIEDAEDVLADLEQALKQL